MTRQERDSEYRRLQAELGEALVEHRKAERIVRLTGQRVRDLETRLRMMAEAR